MHYSVRSSFITWLTKKAVLGHAITSKARVNNKQVRPVQTSYMEV